MSQTETMLRKRLRPRDRRQYHLPTKKIETKGIDAIDPSWRERMRDIWWVSNNIGSPLPYLRDMISPEIEIDTPEFEEKARVNIARHEKFLVLRLLLLEIGGEETCFPAIEEDIDHILERGRYYPGRSKMMAGRPSHCHANAAGLWEANHKEHDIHLCTGYALSDDGMWRQHTWLVHRYDTATQHRTRLIETTTKRLAYFGFEMTDEEAETFADENY